MKGIWECVRSHGSSEQLTIAYHHKRRMLFLSNDSCPGKGGFNETRYKKDGFMWYTTINRNNDNK